jgi:hypothetical protein
MPENYASLLHKQVSARARTQISRVSAQPTSVAAMNARITRSPGKVPESDLPQIDCEARIPLCHGRCCMLTFPLTSHDPGAVSHAIDSCRRVRRFLVLLESLEFYALARFLANDRKAASWRRSAIGGSRQTRV